ncbi:MAG: hypothetical protein WAJ92_04590 [Candidatus Acidiferrales bacterium]
MLVNMLEPLIRSSLPRFQAIYDHAPARARDWMASARGWFLTQLRYAPETFDLLAELRGHESWRDEEISRYQIAALGGAVEHALANVPFYASYPRVVIRTLDDLRRLPVLRRETLREHQEEFLSRDTPALRRIRAGTTGTTGANLQVAYTEELARANWALLLRQWTWAGVVAREPRVTLFGARVVPASAIAPPFWAHNSPERQTLMSIFHLGERTAPAYVVFLREHQGQILEGFPSVLGILADFVLERGEPIPMRAIFTSGEPLLPHLRKKIERAFAARAFDSYGMTEYCGMIQECESGGMHLIPEFGLLEILDEHDQPVPAGQEGYFVWTGFLNRAMPLLRYRIGDRGRAQTGRPCACGRAFPLVVPTITRESDILRCPDGRIFSPRALNQILKHSSGLRFCQFVHDGRERVMVRAVASVLNSEGSKDGGCESTPGAAGSAAEICASLRQLLGPELTVSWQLAREPIVRPGGKIPLIVKQVTP